MLAHSAQQIKIPDIYFSQTLIKDIWILSRGFTKDSPFYYNLIETTLLRGIYSLLIT